MLVVAAQVLERLHHLVLLYLQQQGPPSQLLSGPPAEPHFPPWDVRNVMADERRKVLAGVHIVFSRCGHRLKASNAGAVGPGRHGLTGPPGHWLDPSGPSKAVTAELSLHL